MTTPKTPKRENPVVLRERDDGTLYATWPTVRVRFLLDDGRTVDVDTDRDDSDLREALLRYTGAGRDRRSRSTREGRPVRVFLVDLPFACFGIEVEDGRVVRAPPIAAWTLGRDGPSVRRYVETKRGTIVEVDP